MSIEATVNAALNLENFALHQARTVTAIVEAATPKLATSGPLGTNVNTYA